MRIKTPELCVVTCAENYNLSHDATEYTIKIEARSDDLLALQLLSNNKDGMLEFTQKALDLYINYLKYMRTPNEQKTYSESS